MATRTRRPTDPYTYALGALARRELTSAELAGRLARRGCDPATVASIVTRLRSEGALDDRRAARSRARTAVHVRRRGPRRVHQELQRAGVDRGTAEDVLSEVLDAVDESELIDRALAKRLRGPIADRRQLDRLYRYLVRQGFASDEALAVLRKRTELRDED